MAVKRVGIKEFKDKATQLLAGGEPFVIERHGKPIGFYTPVAVANSARIREAQSAFNEKMEDLARRLGLSVEALEDELFGATSQTTAQEDAPASAAVGRL
ncbi:hypothetical protein DAERI_140125 [Deinococcus aerius]|uniref:Antitoxin n=1 Tax=Deinococcus aerius TaxID=200253 RepID=A0A2I9CZ40_9DEIO|nr:hypothetical protein [Deinococcus aerius]GBF07464.1 hypothetical protein DAERI_140125 [Deinococcus aerius]